MYGASKLWQQLQREGIEVARCTVERLMWVKGLRGAMGGKVVLIRQHRVRSIA